MTQSLGAKGLPAADSPYMAGHDLEHLSHDDDLATKIMKKRQEELQRRSKLLDPRKRQFGVDHAVLDAQIAEKRAAQAAEAAEEAYYAQTMVAQETVLQTIEGLKAQAQRERQRETINFSLTNLSREQRREYMLSCPKEYTSSATTQPEEELGPCSMTRFEGEQVDPGRRKQVQLETANWLKQQMDEKKERQQAEKNLDRELDEKMLEANNFRTHCELASLQDVKDEKCAEAEENLAMAAARRLREQAKAKRDHDERQQHAHSVSNSDFMREVHDYKVGATGKLYDLKRLTLAEEQDVYNSNAHILLDKKHQRQAEKAEEAGEHRRTLGAVAVLGAVEEEQRRQQKERARQMLAHNQSLASAKRANDLHEKRTYRSFEHEP